MRILFVNRYFAPDHSATSQILRDLAGQLVQHGAQVHVVCSRQIYDQPGANLVADESLDGVRVHRVATTSFGRDRLVGRALDYATFYVTATLKLIRLARRGDVIVANTDPPMISVPVAAVARWRGARLINWLQDLFPEIAIQLSPTPLPAWLERTLHRLRNWSLRVAAANVVIGTRMCEELLRNDIATDRIHVIENWNDGDVVAPRSPGSSQLRRQLGLQDSFVVGYSGNLGRAHDGGTLLDVAMALQGDPGVAFLMVGGGIKMRQMKVRSAAERLPNITFLPYQPRDMLADCLAAADVHVVCLLPTLEGLIVPSKIYGILAAGRPTIFLGDADGEVARIIRDADCGLSVPVGDREALLDVVQRLRNDLEWRTAMGVRARSAFLERHTTAHGAQLWWNLLRQLPCQ